MTKLSVLICNRPSLSREGMVVVLDRQDDFHVVGTIDYAANDLDLMFRLDPDIIIVDASVICLSEPDFVKTVRRVDARLLSRVVVFGRITDPAITIRCLREGISGFVEDDVVSEALPVRLREFATGTPVLSRATVTTLLDWCVKGAGSNERQYRGILTKLTTQERRVLDLMSQGKATSKIADILHLGETTIRTYVHRLKHKLDLRTRDELIAFAVQCAMLGELGRD